MIQSHELRKGNTLAQGTIISFYEHGVHVGYGKTYKFSELEPIKVTDKLLKELFDIDHIQEFACELDEEASRYLGMNIDFYNEDGIGALRDMHIHELQNIYLDLTGKQLIK